MGRCGLTWGDEKFSWPIETTPQQGLKGKTAAVYLGRLLGGSSSINTMCWMRGHQSDYDSWASLGVQGWSWREVAPYFKRAEGCTFKCNKDIRGSSGPMKLSKDKEPSYFVSRILEAAEQMGYPITEDLNSGHMEGFAPVESHIHKGVRHSASQGYLQPVLDRHTLHVICNTVVSRVILHNSHASGVEYLDSKSGDLKQVTAKKEVILCCGAALSPKLLLLSGIGPKDELETLGVESVRNLPGVGKNLQAPTLIPISTVGKSDNYYYGAYSSTLTNQKKEMANRDWFRDHSGPHASLGIKAAALIKTDPQLSRPNIHLLFLNGKRSKKDIKKKKKKQKFQRDHEATPGYTCMASTAQCYSRGSVTLQSKDFKQHPLIDYAMLTDNRDVQNSIEAVKLVQQIFQHDAFSDDVKKVTMFPRVVQTDKQFEEYVRASTGSNGYYSGTCKMGSYSDPSAVTDNQGRVWGIGSLRVVDSSIIPDAPSAPLVSVCIMLAEKICDDIESTDHARKYKQTYQLFH